MNPQSLATSAKRSGFTLMELITVITIIAILATMAMPAHHMAMKRMRKLQATNMASNLRTAVTEYQSEYKRFPALSDGSGVEEINGDLKVETTGDSGLMALLMAVKDNEFAEKYNRRMISFFAAKPAKAKGMAGLWVSSEGNYELYDPWKNHYYVIYDADLSNSITAPSEKDGTDTELITDLMVFTHGPNGELGAGDERKNDDIYVY
ncbi:MAG: type II secretion system protein [Verrucomicrobiota bacterium]